MHLASCHNPLQLRRKTLLRACWVPWLASFRGPELTVSGMSFSLRIWEAVSTDSKDGCFYFTLEKEHYLPTTKPKQAERMRALTNIWLWAHWCKGRRDPLDYSTFFYIILDGSIGIISLSLNLPEITRSRVENRSTLSICNLYLEQGVHAWQRVKGWVPSSIKPSSPQLLPMQNCLWPREREREYMKHPPICD